MAGAGRVLEAIRANVTDPALLKATAGNAELPAEITRANVTDPAVLKATVADVLRFMPAPSSGVEVVDGACETPDTAPAV